MQTVRAGELADVVIDPLSKRVTYLVVQPHHQAVSVQAPTTGYCNRRGYAPSV